MLFILDGDLSGKTVGFPEIENVHFEDVNMVQFFVVKPLLVHTWSTNNRISYQQFIFDVLFLGPAVEVVEITTLTNHVTMDGKICTDVPVTVTNNFL